ncbi:MAG: bifunctional phosphopantothenoylcysteine decarboxylase/phosphopantothenate--cysteine ligase CoaBC [Candidatus Thermoplasmatota archaeon]
MHPSVEIRATRSQKLMGKRIVLGITGSIAAVEVVKLARELIRHGTDIYPVMSHAAQQIIHPEAVRFACGHVPILELDGSVQHVDLCGNVADRADLLLIAPATANTISKIACGIDDTPVTTMATTAIGAGIPVMIVPGMHSSMYSHPIVRENLRALEKIGVKVLEPVLAENKAKMASVEEVVAHVLRTLGPMDMKDCRLLVVAGGYAEPWDAVRELRSTATGQTGIAIAVEGFGRGADVELVMAGDIPAPQFIPTTRARTVAELREVLRGKKADAIIVPAAIPDYAPEKARGKTPSDREEMVLRLRRQEKILSHLRKRHKGVLVGFKAEYGVEEKELIKRAEERLKEHRLEMIVANDLRHLSPSKTRAILIRRDGRKTKFEGSKSALAEAIITEVAALLRKGR